MPLDPTEPVQCCGVGLNSTCASPRLGVWRRIGTICVNTSPSNSVMNTASAQCERSGFPSPSKSSDHPIRSGRPLSTAERRPAFEPSDTRPSCSTINSGGEHVWPLATEAEARMRTTAKNTTQRESMELFLHSSHGNTISRIHLRLADLHRQDDVTAEGAQLECIDVPFRENASDLPAVVDVVRHDPPDGPDLVDISAPYVAI